MEEIYYSSISSPLGTIWFASDRIGVCLLRFGLRKKKFLEVLLDAGMTPRADLEFNRGVSEEVNAYFEGKVTRFSSPVHPRGSPFDMKVWEALQRIPLGETRSYQEIAQEVGNPRGCRAVGGANRRNPIPLLIPCHRVIKKDGGLGGFSSGIQIKERLLRFEQQVTRNQR
ncbi:MAG: methylated-DNA--[protein]-cysteine S-methyltransferase [Deltaproteobacteria bacterium]|nr:methylated-DNA--[protein]-cysteine S-methyltransferase [Deltaproteobacteria bacterium]